MDEIIREITSMDPSVERINYLINRIQSGKLKYSLYICNEKHLNKNTLCTLGLF